MSDIAIRAENLSKQYKIGKARRRYPTLRDSLAEGLAWPFRKLSPFLGRDGLDGAGPNARASFRDSGSSGLDPSTIWALKDVTFEIKEGEVVGIIGRNGAGKSTLLKILCRITEPTRGRAEIHGRVGSLLEVGTGFHPELTGRENIYFNGGVLGMRKAEIGRKFDEIVAFAEVEKFIDTPVKRYSSGMYVRLAFAVAAHLEPEILIVDEVLAVGDDSFQKKSLGKMGNVAKEGRTVLFVSHNMASIQQLCRGAILMVSGRLAEQGPTNQVVSRYLGDASSSEAGDFDFSNAERSHGYYPIIRRLTLRSKDGTQTSRFNPEDTLVAELTLELRAQIRNPRIALAIEDSLGRRITTVASHFQPPSLDGIEKDCRIKCTLPRLGLGSGRYLISLGIWTQGGNMIEALQNAAWFEVAWNNSYGNGELYDPIYGPVLTPSTWEKVD